MGLCRLVEFVQAIDFEIFDTADRVYKLKHGFDRT